MFPDGCSVEDYCSRPDQAFVSNPASMNNRPVRNRHPSSNNRSILARAVHHCIVLYATIGAYPDVAIVAPEDRTWPYACPGSDDNIANYRTVRCKNCRSMDPRLLRA